MLVVSTSPLHSCVCACASPVSSAVVERASLVDSFIEASISCGPGGGSGWLEETTPVSCLDGWIVHLKQLFCQLLREIDAFVTPWHLALLAPDPQPKME